MRLKFRERTGFTPALWGMEIILVFLTLLLLVAPPRPSEGLQLAAATKPVPAVTPYIDVHAHLDNPNLDASLQAALEAAKTENAAELLFLPSPFTLDDAARFDAEALMHTEENHRDKLAFLGGGGTLNGMIQQAVRSGDAGPEAMRKFKERAQEIARLGAAGFGELTAEHPPSSTPYQYAPPDHPFFLALADIAALHGLPIDVHMEAVAEAMPIPADWHVDPLPTPPLLHENIAAFERLVAHNPRAKIVWAHAAWDNTGQRTAALCQRLLQAHPNLYMEIKVDPVSLGRNFALTNGASGAIKPEWLKLFQDFPDRFVIGTDQHYPMPKSGPQRWQAVILLFNQLPAELRRKIGTENATRIYRFNSLLKKPVSEAPR